MGRIRYYLIMGSDFAESLFHIGDHFWQTCKEYRIYCEYTAEHVWQCSSDHQVKTTEQSKRQAGACPTGAHA